jgi:hypothetical protein
MSTDNAPNPPVGYRAGYESPTAISWLELLPGEMGLLAGAVGLFGGVLVMLRDTTAVFDIVVGAVLLDSFGTSLALVAAVVAALFLHESVHAVTARLVGCEARIGRHGLDVHVRLRGGFLSRRADALIMLRTVSVHQMTVEQNV